MIVVTSSGQNLNSNVSSRFGRSQHFLVLDEEGNLDEVVSNPGIGANRGAGVQAAQTVADQGAEALITGNIGPNAFSALQSAGVEIFLVSGIKAEEAFEKWKDGDLNKAEVPTGTAGRGPASGRGQGPGKGRGPNGNQGKGPHRS